MEPTGAYAPIRQLVEKHEKETFFQNVKKGVIPVLIKKGILQGKTTKGERMVLQSEAFRTFMRFGIEQFVANQQGWCFTAIRAPIAEVAGELKRGREVVSYRENVKPVKVSEKEPSSGGSMEDDWHFFSVQFPESQWTIIIESVHPFDPSIAEFGERLAADLADKFGTLAIQAWDDDCSGSAAQVFNGKKKCKLSTDEDSWEKFYAYFYEQQIYLPESFIAGDDSEGAVLMLAGLYKLFWKNSGIERATIDPEQVKAVLAANGKLTLQECLRCKVRYFSDGIAIGSRNFVNEIFTTFREHFGPKRKDGARQMDHFDQPSSPSEISGSIPSVQAAKHDPPRSVNAFDYSAHKGIIPKNPAKREPVAAFSNGAASSRSRCPLSFLRVLQARR